eukprot:4014076-Amphidinium_carterae.2
MLRGSVQQLRVPGLSQGIRDARVTSCDQQFTLCFYCSIEYIIRNIPPSIYGCSSGVPFDEKLPYQ